MFFCLFLTSLNLISSFIPWFCNNFYKKLFLHCRPRRIGQVSISMSGVHNKSAYTVQDPRSTVQYSFLKYNSWCNFMESVWANVLWKVGCSRHSWPLQFNFYKLTYQNFDSDKCFTPFTPPPNCIYSDSKNTFKVFKTKQQKQQKNTL